MRNPGHSSPTAVTPRAGRLRRFAAVAAITLGGAALVTVLAAAVVIRAGWYDVGALVQHWQPSFSLMEVAMRYSVRHHARDVVVPPFTEPLVRRGAAVYRQQCLQCHGAPGIAPGDIGLSMQPLPGPLVHMKQRWKPAEIYWLIRNGIKMSGMPAWQYRLDDDDLWAVTALVERLSQLSPDDYAALQDSAGDTSPVAVARPGQHLQALYRQTAISAERGKLAMPQYACQSCHVIPGVIGGQVNVGPALDHYGGRKYVAGYLPNTPDNLARWLRSPRHIKPQSAMPELGVTERDAADMAAYLLSTGGAAD